MSRLKGWSGSKWTKFMNSGKIGKAPSGNGYGLVFRISLFCIYSDFHMLPQTKQSSALYLDNKGYQ